MGDQRLAFLRPADQHLDHSGADSRAVEQPGQEFADGGRLLARLEDHRVAGDQRGNDVAVGQVRGEIIRPQHRHDAVRFVADRGGALQRAVQFALAGALGIGGDRDIHLGDDRLDLGAGFPHRLAGLARDQLGELVVLLARFVGEAADELDAGGERLRGPRRPSAAGPVHGRVDIADVTAPELRARRRLGGYDDVFAQRIRSNIVGCGHHEDTQIAPAG